VEGNGLNNVVELFEYGDSLPESEAKSKNMRGQLIRHYDQAGKDVVLLYSV